MARPQSNNAVNANGDQDRSAGLVRGLVRAASRASLASSLTRNGHAWPYTSLVIPAFDLDACPLLLLSDLAEHSKNISANSRISLLFDGTSGYASPLAGPRVTVLGNAAVVEAHSADAQRLWRRYLARYPDAENYRQFSDFRLYHVAIEAVHSVAGFGEITWFGGAEVRLMRSTWEGLAESESTLLDHMNADHSQSVGRLAQSLFGRSNNGWRIVGIDPDGADFTCNGQRERLNFHRTAQDADACRQALIELMETAPSGQTVLSSASMTE